MKLVNEKNKIDRLDNNGFKGIKVILIILFILIIIGGCAFYYFKYFNKKEDVVKKKVVNKLSIKYEDNDSFNCDFSDKECVKTIVINNTSKYSNTNFEYNISLDVKEIDDEVKYEVSNNDKIISVGEIEKKGNNKLTNYKEFIELDSGKQEIKIKLYIEEGSNNISSKVKVKYNETKSPLATKVIIEASPEGNTDGLKIIEEENTEKVNSTMEYRYSGDNDVYNYVKFNGELWRIIGVFDVDNGYGNVEKRLKIVSNDEYIVDEEDVISNLNDEYYDKLSILARSMIGEALWYLNKTDTDVTSKESYKKERSGNEEVLKKVGLIYPSDYAFASLKCYNNEEVLNNCKEENYLYKEKDLWMLSNDEFLVVNEEGISFKESKENITVYPAVYLHKNVKIKGGSGEEFDPYILG